MAIGSTPQLVQVTLPSGRVELATTQSDADEHMLVRLLNGAYMMVCFEQV